MPSVSCSLSSACLLAGRHEVKENCGGPLVQQSEHWRFSWPCSPLSGVGLVKAMATLQRWLFTASCLAPNANMNWAFLASHSPKASPRCFDTFATKTDAAAKTKRWYDGCPSGPGPPPSPWPPFPTFLCRNVFGSILLSHELCLLRVTVFNCSTYVDGLPSRSCSGCLHHSASLARAGC